MVHAPGTESPTFLALLLDPSCPGLSRAVGGREEDLPSLSSPSFSSLSRVLSANLSGLPAILSRVLSAILSCLPTTILLHSLATCSP